MIIEVILICSLIQADPFYDCPPWYDGDYSNATGDIWFIVVWDDDTVPCWKSKELIKSMGCAIYGSNTIFVTNASHGEPSTTPKWEGMTIFQHELEHLKCRCSWHD